MRIFRLLLALLGLALAGCNDRSPPPPHADTAPADAAAPRTFTDATLHLTLPVPTGMTLRRDFQRSYLDAGAWQTFAGENSQGHPLAALVMDGSDKVTAGELRLSESDAAEALAHCEEIPASAKPDSTSTAKLDGVAFQHFRAGDAAMSHYLKVEGYRAVRDGRCVAIDLLVYGTRPEVYDPPATPPFTEDQAWTALHAALGGLHWTH
jgi:hypothetical protein